MQLATQPIVDAQQPLVACWQQWLAASHLRLGRWLCTAADQPILHDYLLSLSAPPVLPPASPPSGGPSSGWLATQPDLADGTTKWLQPLPANAEHLLHTLLASSAVPLRLLVLEDVAAQPLRRLARWFPATVATYHPAVSMHQLLTAIRQLPAAGEASTAGFSYQFQLLTDAVEQGRTSAVLQRATACLSGSATPLGPGPEVSVWLAVGHYYVRQQQARDALTYFAKALLCAETAYAAGDQAAGLLSLQVWLSEAAAWQQARRRPEVLRALQQAVARAQVLPPNVLGVEAARQLGLALHRADQLPTALASYQQGLLLAERLPPGQRPAATLRPFGDAYHSCLRFPADKDALGARLAALLD